MTSFRPCRKPSETERRGRHLRQRTAARRQGAVLPISTTDRSLVGALGIGRRDRRSGIVTDLAPPVPRAGSASRVSTKYARVGYSLLRSSNTRRGMYGTGEEA